MPGNIPEVKMAQLPEVKESKVAMPAMHSAFAAYARILKGQLDAEVNPLAEGAQILAYAEQLKADLDQYCLATTPDALVDADKALQARFDEGMKFDSLRTLLTRAKSKFIRKPLAKMPDDVSKHVFASMLELKDVTTVALVSTAQAVLFQNPFVRKTMKENEKIHPLFTHLARGEQDQVRDILEEAKNRDPNELKRLLTAKHTLTDHAGRQFDNITLFQLSLWYLDRHMWRMLLPYLQTHLPGEAAQQFEEHDEGRTHYFRDQGRHYYFKGKDGIVAALQAYNDYFKDPHFTWPEADRKWQTEVGDAQRRVPLHVIHEYCREDVAFDPLPDTRFREENLPRTVTFFNWLVSGIMSFWAGLTAGLGTSFGLYRHRGPGWIAGGGLRGARARTGCVGEDLAAASRLCQVRGQEYQALKVELKIIKDLEVGLDPSSVVSSSVSLRS